jgi:hypothetical protein
MNRDYRQNKQVGNISNPKFALISIMTNKRRDHFTARDLQAKLKARLLEGKAFDGSAVIEDFFAEESI